MNFPGLVLMIACTLAWVPARADSTTIYHWTDDHGKVHYGDNIPSSQADLGHSELDSHGNLRRKVERTRLSPAEQQQKAEQRLKFEEEKRREAEQNRHDNALISTYANVAEIDLARDRSISLENQTLNGLQSLLNSAMDKFASADKKIRQDEILDQIPPRGLLQLRKEAGSDIALYKTLLEQREKIIAELSARFVADRTRYLELKERLHR